MARLTLTGQGDFGGNWLPDLLDFGPLVPGVVGWTGITETSVSLIKGIGDVEMEITLTGSGFLFHDGGADENPRPLSGIVTGFAMRFDGDLAMTITDLRAELTDFDHLMFGWSWLGIPFPPDGAQILSALLASNDTIMGSAENDILIQGLNGGDDVIYGGDGSDAIFAGAGSDRIFGGNGDDLYTLADTVFTGAGYRGAMVNLADGRAIDSWGGRDRLVSIEQVIGSRLSDRVIGSDRDETIAGLRGNDTLIGGGGFDVVIYDKDFEHGGQAGIRVNLATGTATDGWGGTDTLRGIEAVIGTRFNDVFIGNRKDNVFNTGMGVDSYDGGAGRDTLVFIDPLRPVARVEVDLRLASGQVIQDGFGNTETVVSIEDLWGSETRDTFWGNASANHFFGDLAEDFLSGGGGNDTLEGGAGWDELVGGAGADSFLFSRRSFFADLWDTPHWRDTIHDFRSGTDRLTFVVEDFAGMDRTVRFRMGTEAGGAGESWFFFDTVTDQLFWDADGIGGAAAVLVAVLERVNVLTAADFELI